MQIADAADILPGYSFRTAIPECDEGRVAVVQARDLLDGEVAAEGWAEVEEVPPGASPLKPGDVLVQPRGMRYPAAVFGLFVPAIAAAPLLILRPRHELIAADYLAAVLMAPSVQATLRNAAVGTHVPQVPRTALAELEIPVPDLETQRRIVDYTRLVREEAHLTERIRELRALCLDQALAGIADKTRGCANTPGS